MQWDGLHTLANAATLLEKRVDPDGPTERDKRKVQAYTQRFKEMEMHEAKNAAAVRERRGKRVKAQGGHALLGKIVWKEFKDRSGRRKMYQGEVISVSWTKKGNSVYNFGGGVTSTVKYLVEYSDGDSEDMTESELRKYVVG